MSCISKDKLFMKHVRSSFSFFISPVVSALISGSVRRGSPYVVICIRHQALQPLQLSVVIDKWTVICNGDKTQSDNYQLRKTITVIIIFTSSQPELGGKNKGGKDKTFLLQ